MLSPLKANPLASQRGFTIAEMLITAVLGISLLSAVLVARLSVPVFTMVPPL